MQTLQITWPPSSKVQMANHWALRSSAATSCGTLTGRSPWQSQDCQLRGGKLLKFPLEQTERQSSGRWERAREVSILLIFSRERMAICEKGNLTTRQRELCVSGSSNVEHNDISTWWNKTPFFGHFLSKRCHLFTGGRLRSARAMWREKHVNCTGHKSLA